MTLADFVGIESDDTVISLGDYVDGCENHLLLADGYSKLAEIICEGSKAAPFAFKAVANDRPGMFNSERSIPL